MGVEGREEYKSVQYNTSISRGVRGMFSSPLPRKFENLSLLRLHYISILTHSIALEAYFDPSHIKQCQS